MVTPLNYKIHLEPDLKTFRFSATVEIRLKALRPVQEIALDAAALAFWSCQMRAGQDWLACRFCVDSEKEKIAVSLPGETSGEVELKLIYEGRINDTLAGFYRSAYGKEGKTGHVAVTQFEENDARRAFPCLDHPSKKALFEVEMVVDEDLIALSNGPPIEERPQGNGRKLVRFQQTPRMSTYLLFFAVGAFEFIEAGADVLIRVAAMPGMARYGHYGLDFGRKALTYCQDYYEIPYPFTKLDLIAIEDFAAGAMENWGAITFRENLLLRDPEKTSRMGEQRICEVIAHEIAHQWFGNLVTPADWKYLWLNESFATYFGYGVVNHYHPEWDVWGQFLHNQTEIALRRDGLQETFSIEIPGGEHVVINVSTAPIIYNKGGSVLRQVAAFVGEESFRNGLRHYLKAHAYDCAASEDLWLALEHASGKPVTALMRSWIEQPGYPLIEVERVEGHLRLRQRRFTYLPGEFSQNWLVPVSVRLFCDDDTCHSLTTLLEGQSVRIPLDDRVIAWKVNAGQTGFYRVKYLDKANRRELGKLVLRKALEPADRWGLQDDLYALVQSGEASINDFLEVLAYYENEDAFLPLAGISGNLYHACLVMDQEGRERLTAAALAFIGPVLSRLGLEPRETDSHTTSILRDQLIWHAVLYGSREAEEFAMDKFFSLTKGRPIHPDIARSVMQTGALRGDLRAFEWLTHRLESSESEHERMNVLTALGSFADESIIETARAFILDSVPPRNKFVPLCTMAASFFALSSMWAWFVSKIAILEQFHPLHFERVIAAVVPVCGLGREKEARDFLDAYRVKTGKAKEAIALSLEKLEINGKMRNAYNAASVPSAR